MESTILEKLNKRQRAAVTYDGGGVLVLAGAGTGKTRVLTSRIAWLMASDKCSASNILAVTFTNKAAKEMRGRVGDISNFDIKRLALGTFHGVCHRMLRVSATTAGWDKNFQIMDTQDQKAFIRRLLEFHQIDIQEYPPADCLRYINAAKEKGRRAADISPDSPRTQSMRDIYELYENACRKDNKLDFAELLLSAIDLLSGNKEIRQHYAQRFNHILIDEFQDSNELQYRWLKLLDSGTNIYFAVGDDDQTIYTFRGARPGNMHAIQRELRVSHLIRLEENYRSTGNILLAANQLISGNRNRLGKKLFTQESAGALIRVVRKDTDMAEAATIVRDIQEKINSGEELSEIAILYRTNAQSRLLEQALVENNINYRVYGGTRFFDRQEIKHAMAYVSLAIADDAQAMSRVINFPPRGIGAKTIESLAAQGDFFRAIGNSDNAKVAAFRALIQQLRETAKNDNLLSLVKGVVEKSGLLLYYQTRPDNEDRIYNLQELVNAAGQFSAEDDEEPILAFLANATLNSGEAQNNGQAQAVNLMTVHAAKGLEFMVVYIAGVGEGLFPHRSSLESADRDEVEEERRLMYVAITRARRELCLYHADRYMVYGNLQIFFPSRFLDELPTTITNVASPLSPPSLPKRGIITPRLPSSKLSSPKGSYRLGDLINHQKYGNGVVIRSEGGGDDLKIEVVFKKIGSKTFMAALAPIKKL